MTTPDDDAGGESPRTEQPVLRSAPKVGEVYWCRFHPDAIRPEFHKRRPVMVASYKNTLADPVLVIPFSTSPQNDNRWAIPCGVVMPSDHRQSWIVCNHLYTVSCARLTPDRGQVPRIIGDKLDAILTLARHWLASPKGPPTLKD